MKNRNNNYMWQYLVGCIFLVVAVYALIFFPRSNDATADEIRRVIEESKMLELAIPSYRDSHSAVMKDSRDIKQIAASFNPIAMDVVDSSYAAGAGGNSIVVTCPDVSDWTLVVGNRWSLLVTKQPDKTEKWVRFAFEDDALLRVCAKKAGFAYPLMSDVFGER